VYAVDASGARVAVRRRPESLDSVAFSQDADEANVPPAVLPQTPSRPGPKGPLKEWIDAVVQMKRRNPTWGCKRIAQQITLAFSVDIDKDLVRRIVGTHFRPELGSGGPSWLSLSSHAKDSLWSIALFRM
jgi:hypothetical protein